MTKRKRPHRNESVSLQGWIISAAYVVVSVVLGLTLPRLENSYFPGLAHGMSASAALAFFSAVSSGMMALTGIVFAVAFVIVQFGAVAYSPRLVVMFTNNPRLYHALGIFFATFGYSLAALVWTDRGGSGVVPLFSTMLVGLLVITSMFAFVGMVNSLNDMQIHNVLRIVGEHGRQVIAAMYQPLPPDGGERQLPDADRSRSTGPVTQTITYMGEPRSIASFDTVALMRLAESVGGMIELDYAVGDTALWGTTFARLRGARKVLDEAALMQAVELADTRTMEQDPKYPIRLLVDIAIRALSPAVNDPTTGVQALDQIEDLLRRLGQSDLDIGQIRNARGELRVIVPMPTWSDYLSLSFDEIRQFGVTSVQILRRLRSALSGLAAAVSAEERRVQTASYLRHLDLDVERSALDDTDRVTARQEDRQGLGMPRERSAPAPS
jgi:uncharacterized membrane protein